MNAASAAYIAAVLKIGGLEGTQEWWPPSAECQRDLDRDEAGDER